MNDSIAPQHVAVLSREFSISYDQAYAFIAEPGNLPKWALAFREADASSAVMQLPDGAVLRVSLETRSSHAFGVVDWHITLPDGSIEIAWSRLCELRNGNAFYVFNFGVRPGPETEMAATLAEQRRLVEQEFDNLERIFAEMTAA